jgi:threonine-phosphate decarboxylase
MIIGHGGNVYCIAQQLGCEPSEIIDMSSNVNPLGPPDGLIGFLKENLHVIKSLPEVDSNLLVHSFAGRHGIDPSCVLAGNGSTQFIYAIPLALQTRYALILGPTYADYADACNMHNIRYRYLLVNEAQGFKADWDWIKRQIKESRADTVFVCNPNNPTGVFYSFAEIESLCAAFPEKTFIIDESYLPFVPSGSEDSMIACGLPNVIVLNSMSKIFRISGLRIGFVIASKNIIDALSHYALPWSVNAIAQVGVCYLMEHEAEVDTFIRQTHALIENEKKRFAEQFKNASNLTLFESTTSFILGKLDPPHTADFICQALLSEKILIRNCSNFKGLSNRFIRISLKNGTKNKMLISQLLALISQSGDDGKNRYE